MIDLSKFDRIKTFGKSMFPFLQHGYVVYYKPIQYKDITINDVIVVKSKYTYFTHRVIFKNNDYVITKGDNNFFPDEPAKQEQIIGKAYKVKRKGKIIRLAYLYLMQSILYNKEIRLINSNLRKNIVRFLFLKGLPLHLYYEKHHPKRIYADCDIMINKNDKDRVESIFHALGYAKANEELINGYAIKESNTEINYFKAVQDVRIVFDVHFEPAFMMTKLNINHRFYEPELLQALTRHFLGRKREIRIDQNKFYILQPVELVAYLALHFFHHNYRGIYRLELIKEIIMKEFSNTNWHQLSKLITKYKLQNFVFPVFILLKDYYKVRIPITFQQTIHPKGFLNAILLRRVKNTVFISQTRFQAGIERFLLLLLLSPKPIYKRLGVFIDPEVIRTSFQLIYIYLLPRIKKISLRGKLEY